MGVLALMNEDLSRSPSQQPDSNLLSDTTSSMGPPTLPDKCPYACCPALTCCSSLLLFALCWSGLAHPVTGLGWPLLLMLHQALLALWGLPEVHPHPCRLCTQPTWATRAPCLTAAGQLTA